MLKKIIWPIEVIIITCFFGTVLQIILYIGSGSFNCLAGGFALNVVACLTFLFYAIYRLIEFGKNNDRPFSSFFNKRILFKDIWIIFLIPFVGRVFYNLMLKIEFVKIFGTSSLPQSDPLIGFQAWVMIFLIVLFIPIVAFSEELYFRCYLFQVQHERFKNYTWILNGISWSIFHLFTPTNFIAILPSCFMYSYVYQKTRNIWITIITHLLQNTIVFYPIIKAYISQ